jgi:hypothetical protein
MNTFFYRNLINTYGVNGVADSAAADYPASNLGDYNSARPWRSADAASAHNVVFDFGTAVGVDTVSLINVNFTTSATVKIQANTTDSWGSPAFENTFQVSGLGLDPPHYNLLRRITEGSPETYRFWRLYISDTTNPDGFYEVGELLIGVREDMATGQDFQGDQNESFPDANVVHQTEYLHEIAYVRDVEDVRIFDLVWEAVNETTKNELRKLKRYTHGSGLPFVFCPDGYTTPVECFYVRMQGTLNVKRISPIAWTVGMNLREQARGKIVS